MWRHKITSQILMICGNAIDFIDHPLPYHFLSAHGASHHAWAPAPHYCGPLTTSWKMYSWFARHTVHGIAHKSLAKYHSLHMSSFGSAERLSFCSLFAKHQIPLICCVSHNNHRVHSGHNVLTHPWQALSSYCT